MTPARRAALDRVILPHPVAHAGLELDRYLPEAVGGENKALHDLLARVCAASPPPVYVAAFDRWLETVTAWGEEAAHGVFSVADRLVLGLGGASVRETGVTLHHLYGVPLIPGPALKGLARRFARSALTAAGSADVDLARAQLETLVGSPDSAAFLTFFDAWYVPKSAPADRPLQPDVITVHHPTYYGSRGTRGHGPWDFDDPTPVPFVRQTGSYLVAVRGPDADWAQFALATLARALETTGIGAKTSSGFGRLRQEDPRAAAAADEAASLTAEIAALPEPTAKELETFYRRCRTDLPEEFQLAPMRAIVAHLRTPRLQGYLNYNWAKLAVARVNRG